MNDQQPDPINTLLAALALSVGEAKALRLFVDAMGAVLDEILPEELAAECQLLIKMITRPKTIVED